MTQLTQDEAVALLIADRERMDRESVLHVAKSKTTGRYLLCVQGWIYGNQGWMKANNPTVEEVKEQMAVFENHFGTDCWWTNYLQRAELWNRYYIAEYRKFLSDDIEFEEVNIGARPC